jgi:hypothetical protein
MEGISRHPGFRAAEFARDHPDVSICQVEGTWHATVYLDCGYGEMHGRTEDELVDKLAAALGG